MSTGRAPTDADLADRVREMAPRWERLRTVMAEDADGYFDPDDPHADPKDELARLAKALGIRCSIRRWRDREGYEVVSAAVWCSGIMTGGAMKGVIYAEHPKRADLAEVTSCDGRPPWPGCPEHADCVVPIEGQPKWFVFCNFDT